MQSGCVGNFRPGMKTFDKSKAKLALAAQLDFSFTEDLARSGRYSTLRNRSEGFVFNLPKNSNTIFAGYVREE